VNGAEVDSPACFNSGFLESKVKLPVVQWIGQLVEAAQAKKQVFFKKKRRFKNGVALVNLFFEVAAAAPEICVIAPLLRNNGRNRTGGAFLRQFFKQSWRTMHINIQIKKVVAFGQFGSGVAGGCFGPQTGDDTDKGVAVKQAAEALLLRGKGGDDYFKVGIILVGEMVQTGFYGRSGFAGPDGENNGNHVVSIVTESVLG